MFDVPNENYQVQDIGYLRGQRGATEFGGRFEFCSDAEFYCVGAPLLIVVPRRPLGQRDWTFEGWYCEADQPFTGERTQIACTIGQETMRFSYSARRGIERYAGEWLGAEFI